MSKQAGTTQANDQWEIVYARDRGEWRAWLERNHATTAGVWLVYYKKGSGQPSVSYAEAVEEALCFGWIDSLTNTLDEARYKQVFTPRKPKSVWSKLNKRRIEQMIERGLMTAAGMEKIEAAQRDGSWTTLDAIEELQFPADFIEVLAADQTAYRNFMAFSPSAQKNIVRWIDSARRDETRLKRIQETVMLAAQNIKAYPYRR